MRALQALIIVMGGLILAGVAGLGVVIAQRLSGPEPVVGGAITLPDGARVVEMAGVGDRLVLRILASPTDEQLWFFDPRTAKQTGLVTLRTAP